MPETADLLLPHHFSPPAPAGDAPVTTMLLLHGAGGDERSLVPAGEQVAPGAALLSPRGDAGGDRGMTHLRRGADGAIDPDEAHRCADQLAEFLDGACAAYHLDPARVWCIAFGEGAAAAAALAVDHPDLVAGGVFLSGMAPFLDADHRLLGGKGAFCAWGRKDDSVTLDEYEQLVELLVASGAEVVLRWYDIGHEISDEELRDAAAWFRARLAAGTP